MKFMKRSLAMLLMLVLVVTVFGSSYMAAIATETSTDVTVEDEGLLNKVPFTNATEKATRAQTAQILTNYLRAN